VCTPTIESVIGGSAPKTPALPRAMPSSPSAGARPGALRSRTRGWLRLYFQDFLFGGGACRPHTPRFPLHSAYCSDGSLPRATKRLAGRGAPPPHTRFPLRSGCLADASLSRATKRLPSCARAWELVKLFATEIFNDETFVEIIAAAARIGLS
jgi:hypothetical protein